MFAHLFRAVIPALAPATAQEARPPHGFPHSAPRARIREFLGGHIHLHDRTQVERLGFLACRRVTADDAHSGALLRKEPLFDNHSRVMYDPALIPPELLRT